MLEPAALSDGGQREVRPARSVLILCDDGGWHSGVIRTWARDRDRRWACFVDYYAKGHHFEAWFVYCAAALRSVPDWSEDPRHLGER